MVLRLELQLYGGHHRQAHREGEQQVAGGSPVKFLTKENILCVPESEVADEEDGWPAGAAPTVKDDTETAVRH